MSTASLHPTALAVNPPNTCATPGAVPVRPGIHQSAAVELDQAPAPEHWPPGLPMLPESTPATALDAALALIAAGSPVFPQDPKAKRPARAAWQTPGEGSTLDPDTARAWWGPGGRYRRCGVGAALRAWGQLALDPDTPEATAALAELAAAADGWPPTFVVMSARGVKVFYPRPEDLADKNGAQVHRPELGGADLLFNNVLAWAPGRRWIGSPADIAPTRPAWLDQALDAIATLAREPGMTGLPGAALRSLDIEHDRGAAYLAAVIEGQAGRLAGLASGTGRPVILHSAACHIGARLWLAPEIEVDARAALYAAAVGAGVAADYGERSTWGHIDRGLAWGKAHPAPAPIDRPLEDRADWTPGGVDPSGQDLAPAAAAEVERTRAAARVILADPRGLVEALRDDDGQRIHPAARFTVELLAAELARRHADAGRPTIAAGTLDLGLFIGRGADAVRRAWPWIRRAGWTVEPGGMDADGTARATRYTLQVENRQDAGDPLSGSGDPIGADDGGAFSSLRVLSVSSSALCRGARSRQVDQVTGRAKPAMGGAAAWVLAAVEALQARGETPTAAAIASEGGVCLDTARRNLAAAVELGPLAADQLERDGSAGRPVLVYRLVESTTAAVQALLDRGERIIRRAVEGMLAFRDRRRAALRGVELGLFKTWAEAFAEISKRWRRRAAGERESVKPGGERGRPDLGRSEWIGAVKRQAAALVTASTPPEWAAGLLPLGTFADDWSGDPDPVINFALQLGAVPV